MKPQTGIIESVTAMPGRRDYFHLRFTPAGTYGVTATFSMEDGVVTIDGKACASVGELFEWLAGVGYGATATVHPCPSRYGMSLRTEFVSAGPVK